MIFIYFLVGLVSILAGVTVSQIPRLFSRPKQSRLGNLGLSYLPAKTKRLELPEPGFTGCDCRFCTSFHAYTHSTDSEWKMIKASARTPKSRPLGLDYLFATDQEWENLINSRRKRK